MHEVAFDLLILLAGIWLMDIPASFVLSDEDALYICGTLDAFDRFHREFSD